MSYGDEIGSAFGMTITVGASVIALDMLRDLNRRNKRMKPIKIKPIKIKPFEGFRL